ncbi:MAG: amino acid adenylation domain-containing protein, partial [Clostridiaceae bacterium]|nr:amino acid adenylation domain-containing protein [Clostridiaceae bacterium]
ELAELIDGFIRPFDLGQAPLLRVEVLRFSETRHALLLDMHHIISDGTSMGIMINELISIYEGKELQPIGANYKDFALWQKELVISGRMAKQEAYWLKTMSGSLPVLDLPTDFQRPVAMSFDGNNVEFSCDRETAKKLKNLAAQTGSTLFMVILAAYNVLLSKYTGQEDLIVGTPVAGRRHSDIQDVIGMFVNTLALRNYPKESRTFMEFLEEVRDNTLEAFENQDYQLEELVERLNIPRDLSRNPLFDTMFSLVNIGEEKAEFEELEVKPLDNDMGISKFDISLYASEDEDGIRFDLEFSSQLFKKETIENMAGHFIKLLDELTKNPSIELQEINMLQLEERNRILTVFNDTKAVYPDKETLYTLFEKQAEKTPESIALQFEDRTMTYNELKVKSDQLAQVLVQKGVEAGTIVGIMVERSFEMLIGILGILKAGGAYLPITPETPKERTGYMLYDSKAFILLTQDKFKGTYFEGVETISLEDGELYSGAGGNIEGRSSPSDLAYIIYTSGSTGKPKGVMIEHASAVNILDCLQEKYPVGADDIYLLKTTYIFDVSVAELFGWFLDGGRLAILKPGDEKDPLSIVEAIGKYRITHINFVPSMFNVFVSILDKKELEALSGLKYIFLAGEAVQPASIEKFHSLCPEVRLENIYGPTESTIYATCYSLKNYNGETNVSIGKPMQNIEAYIVDKKGRLAPLGIRGELCLSGTGLARGYLNNPELTAEKFVDNPFIPDGKMYRTGDLARWSSDGNIEYMGRLDFQVKIRGFRIELGEIEASLMKLDGITQAVVADRQKDGDRVLAAYIVSDKEIDIQDIRTKLLKELPYYMVPSYFVGMDSIPLNSSGKADRKALPGIDDIIDVGAEYEAPENRIQEIIIEVFKDVLGVKKIGIRDNLFLLGGDSIKAIQISTRLRKFGIKAEIKDLFKAMDIKELSGLVKQSVKKSYQGAIQGEVPLSPIQRWFFNNNSNERNHFNMSELLFREVGFETALLDRVIYKLMEHHDQLRAVYKEEEGKIIQFVRGMEGILYELETIDISEAADIEQAIEIETQRLQKKLDIERGPLLTLAIFKTGKGDYLFFTVHHLVVDGISLRIIMEDLEEGYLRLLEGKEIVFEDKTDPYREWSEKISVYADSDELLKELEYWKSIDNQQVRKLPRDWENDSNYNKDSSEVVASLDSENTGKLLTEVSSAYNTEINDLLLAALVKTINEWTENNRVAIAFEGHGREQLIEDLDISRTVGWFTSIYPVVFDIEKGEDESFTIKNIKETIRHVPNKGAGYNILKYMTSEERKKGLEFKLEPEICFNYFGQFETGTEDGLFRMSDIGYGNPVGETSDRLFTLVFTGVIMDGVFSLTIDYNCKQYRESTVNTLAQNYMKHLVEIIEHCKDKGNTELTPSDFKSNDLSIEELEDISDMLEDIEL